MWIVEGRLICFKNRVWQSLEHKQVVSGKWSNTFNDTLHCLWRRKLWSGNRLKKNLFPHPFYYFLCHFAVYTYLCKLFSFVLLFDFPMWVQVLQVYSEHALIHETEFENFFFGFKCSIEHIIVLGHLVSQYSSWAVSLSYTVNSYLLSQAEYLCSILATLVW